MMTKSSNSAAGRKRFPIVWFILSAIMVLVYMFSIAVRSEWTLVRSERYTVVLLADGRLAAHTREEQMWADNHSLSFEGVLWSPEVKLMPKYEHTAWGSSYAIVLPLWILALPVWLITLVKWRRSRRMPADHCAKCGYDLRGLNGQSLRCPECGSSSAKAST